MSNEDTIPASRDAHTAFAETVQEFEQAAENAQPAPEPNVADLEWLNNQQAAKDETGRRRYETDQSFREKLEAARIKVFAGESIADVRSATDRALNGEPEPAQAPTEPKPAEGSPGERMSEYLEQGGTVGQSDVNEGTWDALTAGYNVHLPEGYVLAGEHVEMLWNARNSGVSQDIVTRYIAEALKE